MEYRWINNFTGEVHTTFLQAIRISILDMIRCKKCRIIKMLDIRRWNND